MKIYTIDYKKHFWNDWTVYTQTIKIDRDLQKRYNNKINRLKRKTNKNIGENHHFTNDEMKILYFTKSLKKWVNYMHLTWLHEFWIFLTDRWLYDVRMYFNRNTIIEVL